MQDNEIKIESSAILIGDSKNLKIGEGSWVGSYCNLRYVKHKIIIGKNVLISQLVSIITDSHNYQDVLQPIKEQGVFGADIKLEDNSWIGCNSVILHGVTIGTGAVVAAGSVVTKSVPPYCVVAGVPAKIIKRYSFKKKSWYPFTAVYKLRFKMRLL